MRKLGSERLNDLLKVLLLRIGSTSNRHLATLKPWGHPRQNNSRGGSWEGQTISRSPVQPHSPQAPSLWPHDGCNASRPCSKSYFPLSSNLMAKEPQALAGSAWVRVHPCSHRREWTWAWEVGSSGGSCGYQGRLNGGKGPKQDALVCVHVCMWVQVCVFECVKSRKHLPKRLQWCFL